MCGLMF